MQNMLHAGDHVEAEQVMRDALVLAFDLYREHNKEKAVLAGVLVDTLACALSVKGHDKAFFEYVLKETKYIKEHTAITISMASQNALGYFGLLHGIALH